MSAAPHLTDEQISAVVEQIAGGISLRKACQEAGYNYSNILRRIKASPDLSALDARAREDYQRNRVEMMDEIARDEPDVARARLMCDNIKWEAARVARKLYGDKTEISGPDGGAIGFVLYGERESADGQTWQAQHSPK